MNLGQGRMPQGRKPLVGAGSPAPSMKPPMRKPMGGAVENTRSIFNPNDLAKDVVGGRISPNMSIADFFKSKGVDINGPLSQLSQFAARELQNSTPSGRMQTLSGQGQAKAAGPAPSPMMGKSPAQPKPQGMEALMAQVGGR